MTGDGVNDVLALKDADCSVAFESGSEAATQVAQVVLLDNDFSKMPSVVLEGRRVVNNIQRSAGLFFCQEYFFVFIINPVFGFYVFISSGTITDILYQHVYHRNSRLFPGIRAG